MFSKRTLSPLILGPLFLPSETAFDLADDPLIIILFSFAVIFFMFSGLYVPLPKLIVSPVDELYLLQIE